jgi:hypothetical protein
VFLGSLVSLGWAPFLALVAASGVVVRAVSDAAPCLVLLVWSDHAPAAPTSASAKG